MSYFVSFAIGLAVGVVYGLLAVRSPAPPILGLLGLLGILAGENAVAAIKRLSGPSAQIRTADPPEIDGVQNATTSSERRR